MYMKQLLLQRAITIVVAIILGLKLFFFPEDVKPGYRKKSKLRKFFASATASVYAKVLQPLILCLEDQVCRMNTLSYRRRRYQRQYRSQSIPGFKSISRTLIHVGIYLHLLSSQQKVLASRSLCLYAMHSEMEGHVETDKGPPSFDTDSYEIGIDNRASYSMSHREEDFEGDIKMTNRRIRGIAGTLLTRVGYGTLLWKIEDDTGRSHDIRLPNSLYVPEGGVRLLSPQHWAQHARYNRPNPRGTGCVTYNNSTEERFHCPPTALT